jgi:uncharacterized membrane protein YjjP (DUF1212 family)
VIYPVSMVLSFFAVFLKGFQLKNVQHDQYGAIALTSYAIAFFEVATVTLILKGGWWIALTSGTGGALGMLFSIYAHRRIFNTSHQMREG